MEDTIRDGRKTLKLSQFEVSRKWIFQTVVLQKSCTVIIRIAFSILPAFFNV
jgi:hypothetical protein